MVNTSVVNAINRLVMVNGKTFDRDLALKLAKGLTEVGFVRDKNREYSELRNMFFSYTDKDNFITYEVSLAKEVMIKDVNGNPTFFIVVDEVDMKVVSLGDNMYIDVERMKRDPNYEYTRTSPVPGDCSTIHVRKGNWRDACRSMCD